MKNYVSNKTYFMYGLIGLLQAIYQGRYIHRINIKLNIRFIAYCHDNYDCMKDDLHLKLGTECISHTKSPKCGNTYVGLLT